MTQGIWRRLLAEAVGTGLLVAVVVGSGIMAQTLSPHDVGLQLLENALATVFGLAVLITWLGPASGAHFNPVVSLADWWVGRGRGTGLSFAEAGAYSLAQVVGGSAGAIAANAMFDLPTRLATNQRGGLGLLLAEVIATAGLVSIILGLVRTERTHLAAPAVAAWIGSAYWFTSSTSFANPAVTIARALSDSFAGIAPASVPGFVLAQVIGGAVGIGLAMALFPRLRSEHTIG